MSKYLGDVHHGYWWLEITGQLKFRKTLYDMEPASYFRYAKHVVAYWNVTCQFEWYKMQKEAKELIEGTAEPITA